MLKREEEDIAHAGKVKGVSGSGALRLVRAPLAADINLDKV